MVTIMTGKIANPGPSGPACRLQPRPGAAELTTAPPALATSSRKPRTSSSWSASASDDGREASLSRRAGLGVRCGGVEWVRVGAKGGAESVLEVVDAVLELEEPADRGGGEALLGELDDSLELADLPAGVAPVPPVGPGLPAEGPHHRRAGQGGRRRRARQGGCRGLTTPFLWTRRSRSAARPDPRPAGRRITWTRGGDAWRLVCCYFAWSLWPATAPRSCSAGLAARCRRSPARALGYARTLRPLAVTALHVAVDPDHARALAERWARLGIDVPLEVVSCPDRDLPGAVRQAVAARSRPDTAVTVLIPEHHYGTLLDWALHDRTAQRLLHGLDDLEDGQGAVHLTVMPYHVGPRRRRAATTPRRRRQRLPAPRWATSGAA